MPLLQVKDFPERTYEQLRECAVQEHRSISQQTIHIIEQFLVLWNAKPSTLSPASGERTFSYAEDPNDTTDYAAKRRRVFAEIEQLPSFPVTADFPSAAEILATAREEDAR